ncbi:MAG: UDP-N-acetylglucosamine--N-acetylmuramyl-(pentapeptide) pyrophosphoryl-undecaprenol N-acetylglucosamine transferase [Chloroflexi bacterium]|nr:UDP-N-acetylglucosamine--N-acetylmuramyl-(pentapeptide) pyrophosphoryl-undecaprenol N-acetylglucosamine transferase [Chloroflexota bacterium]
MRLAVCGGGTGGHVYPALSIAAAAERELPPGEKLDALYLGSQEGVEAELVQQADVPLRRVSSGPIRGRNPWELARNAARMAVGVAQARKALSEFAAQAVLSTGGYTSFPVALAARSRKIPIALYLPDVYPGWAIRAIARLARRIAVTAPETLRKLPADKTVVTGYPVREEFWRVNRPEGRERLGLDLEEKVLFVAGASQGAHSINKAVADNLRSLLELCEVVHVSGRADEAWLTGLAEGLPARLRPRYHLFGYLHEDFPWAMAAADLALCRAGASVLGELPAVGLPAVLVPYPYAGAHQRLNARHLADNGAAIILKDRDLGSMLALVGGLLHDSARLDEMSQASRRLARPHAARDVARLILELARS